MCFSSGLFNFHQTGGHLLNFADGDTPWVREMRSEREEDEAAVGAEYASHLFKVAAFVSTLVVIGPAVEDSCERAVCEWQGQPVSNTEVGWRFPTGSALGFGDGRG